MAKLFPQQKEFECTRDKKFFRADNVAGDDRK
jgi:hypothetical protein